MNKEKDFFLRIISITKRISLITLYVLFFLTIILIIFYILDYNFAYIITHPLFLTLDFIIMLLLIILYYSSNLLYKKKIGKLISSIYPNLRYEIHNKQISQKILESNLFPIKKNLYKMNDFISATLNEYTLYSADVKALYKSDTKDSPRNNLIFKGRWIVLEIHQNLNINLLIRADKIKAPINHKKLVELETESIEFNQKYNLYTSNRLDALKILKPTQILEMLDLETKHPGHLAFEIKQNILHIAYFDQEDFFELKNTNNLFDIKNQIDEILLKANEIYTIFKK